MTLRGLSATAGLLVFIPHLHSTPPLRSTRRNIAITFGIEQELSYRKQIARQLRTQFVEGISVTLKSTLMVTRSHETELLDRSYTTYY